MTPRIRLAGALLGALLAALPAGAAGCSCDSFNFYDVVRTTVDECDILPDQELCDEEGEGLAAPVFEVWAIERRGAETRVIVDEEVWFADPPKANDPADDPERLTSSKLEVATVEPGPCTTTTTRSFSIVEGAADENGLSLTGEFTQSTRLTGPADCGETPRGQRSIAELAGTLAAAP